MVLRVSLSGAPLASTGPIVAASRVMSSLGSLPVQNAMGISLSISSPLSFSFSVSS